MADDKIECPCTEDLSSSESSIDLNCDCPKDEHDLTKHKETCIFYRNERLIFPGEEEACVCKDGICRCCMCPANECRCVKVGKEDVEEWRKTRPIEDMPAVMETNHPLMQKFQQALKQFLERENKLAEETILNLRDEMKLAKAAYAKDLEAIYKSDHDTNAQRTILEEYEANLSKLTEDRLIAEENARRVNREYQRAKDRLEKDVQAEKESIQEFEALTMLCSQLEEWKNDTESDMNVTNRMSEKMKQEKKAMANEKRQLDMMIYGLNTEIWKLEAKLELYKKQIEIKTVEMDKVNDKVIAYAAELEDLDLDKRRLVSLWNAVIVNIKQRDKAFDSVREDYRALQENFRTLVINLGITKKVILEEMTKGKEIEMKKDKLLYDYNAVSKNFEIEDSKRITLEGHIGELRESIDMCERDQELIKMENNSLQNRLSHISKDLDKKTEKKLEIENQILANIQECLLNDKAVESMASGIKKLRAMSRKQEMALMTLENQHAKVMFDIEVYRARQSRNAKNLEETEAKVKVKEKALEEIDQKYSNKVLLLMRKQRELDTVTKRYFALKEIFDHKSPQVRRIEDQENQIKGLRERTEALQEEWLRLQGHVVKLASQHQTLTNDNNLINKQIQICDEKSMRITANCETMSMERDRVERSLRDLRGRLQVLERNRYESQHRNKQNEYFTMAMTHEYVANLKDAENEVLELEQDIEDLEQGKEKLTMDLDKMQREALIWQRKGILALELKRNVHNAKSAAGDIGKMKNEIHRMEVRREQLRRIADRMADDMAQCVTRRETVLEKSRATAAVEKEYGSTTTSQTQYKHKLRLAKADMTRVAKEVKDATERLKFLEEEQERLERETADLHQQNSDLEETVADLIRQGIKAEQDKQWLLERVVRSQRMGSELTRAIKRQSLRIRKPRQQLNTEYTQNIALNERLRYILDILAKEYPYLEDKLETIANTLTIHSPSTSPRLLTTECLCGQVDCICLPQACFCPRDTSRDAPVKQPKKEVVKDESASVGTIDSTVCPDGTCCDRGKKA